VLRLPVAVVGALLVALILWETFETIVLPRRVVREFRLTRLFYRSTWAPWLEITLRVPGRERQEALLGFFGPLSLILLIALWAAVLVLGFAMVLWGGGAALRAPEAHPHFTTFLYLSGVTFFTLGFGDVVPHDALGRTVTVVEVATGFGFLALVVSYLPVLYQAFSRRETAIALLDARAGSPPCAVELVRRAQRRDDLAAVPALLAEWERWCAELLESHLSYPQLMFYRSQHERQSWVAALTVILDLSALVLAGLEGLPRAPAELTFAMARHAAVDLCQVFRRGPPPVDRLPPAELSRLRAVLAEAGIRLADDAACARELAALRRAYEPYVSWLGQYLHMPLPPWLPPDGAPDAWQTTADEATR
jgi:hypothetical protein